MDSLLHTMTHSSRAVSEQVSPQPVLVHVVLSPQVQDPALAFKEFQKDIGHFWIQYLHLGVTTGLQLDPIPLITTV